MALTNMTASHIVDAMEADNVARIHNPLKDKIVHADIRVRDIVNDIGNEPQDEETNVSLIEQTNSTTQDVQDQERAEEMQSWWNNEMKKHMNQPDGYAKVAVLLIKWADELDELKTKREVLATRRVPTDNANMYRRPSSTPSSANASSTRPQSPNLTYGGSPSTN